MKLREGAISSMDQGSGVASSDKQELEPSKNWSDIVSQARRKSDVLNGAGRWSELQSTAGWHIDI